MSVDSHTKTGASTRRHFLKGAALASAAVVTPGLAAGFFRDGDDRVDHGDIAILRFLAAAEIIEEDLWVQYAQLTNHNPAYRDAINAIDDAIPKYAVDTTTDERSHNVFINAFLRAIGAPPVSLEAFRVLPAVQVTGSSSARHITNLRAVTVDTSWYLRYRSHGSPDFGATFPQFVTIHEQATVPVSNSESADSVKAAAYCAAFHFPTIEQGGTSLYASLLQKVSSLDALRILAGIGPVEAIHFSIFHDALEGLNPFTTPSGIMFPDIENHPELGQAVMPVPTTFLSPHLPECSVVRPTSNRFAGARAAAEALIASNVFLGQSHHFFAFLRELANQADNAARGFSGPGRP